MARKKTIIAQTDFGLLIRKKRGDESLRNISQSLSIDKNMLALIEKGAIPSLKNFFILCDWLNISYKKGQDKLQIFD